MFLSLHKETIINQMKVIIIYSGKGGVGKTTTTANLAKVLSSQGKKVFVLDADVNTPSMNNVFPEQDVNKNLHVESMGYETKRMIYIQQSMIRKYINTCIRAIKEYDPEYVLIDTPPSITDVHISLIESMKVSGIIMVTQPNIMSRQDVMRTHMFFQSKDVETIGIVENMVETETDIVYPWPILGKVGFIPGFDFNEVYKKNYDVYVEITKSLDNIDAVLLETKKNTFTDESITEDDLVDLYGRRYADKFPNGELPKFVNIATWDFVRGRLSDLQSHIGQHDEFLNLNDSNTIAKMLKAFEEDEQAYFMVIRSPDCEIKVMPGEIGQASLDLTKDSYYGVPRIKYHTAKGDITLFPHEVSPADRQKIEICMEDGGTISKDGRYIPGKEIMRELYNCFGSTVGLGKNWEKQYDEIFGK
jgi:Mrp family chromosome partitioning ATPase